MTTLALWLGLKVTAILVLAFVAGYALAAAWPNK